MNEPNDKEKTQDSSREEVGGKSMLAVLSWVDSVIKNLLEDNRTVFCTGTVDRPKGEKETHMEDEYDFIHDEVWLDQKSDGYDAYYGSFYVRRGLVWVKFQFFS